MYSSPVKWKNIGFIGMIADFEGHGSLIFSGDIFCLPLFYFFLPISKLHPIAFVRDVAMIIELSKILILLFRLVFLTDLETHNISLIFGELILCVFLTDEMEGYRMLGESPISRNHDKTLIFIRNLFVRHHFDFLSIKYF